MRNAVLIISILLISINSTFSQNKIKIGKTCSYNGVKLPEYIYTFSSDRNADKALELILDASGLSKNFKLLSGDVPNACATLDINPITNQVDRYIIYNQTFMNNISKHNNYWASISILAHEIGHHLNGHSLLTGGSRPKLELEADKFSGFILAKLGATLEEAQSAVNTLPEEGSNTHPPRSARLTAVANGFYSGNSYKSSKDNITTSPRSIGWTKDSEKVFIKRISTYKYILISQSKYEFNNVDFKEIQIDENIKLFWFPKYSTYIKILDFNSLELNRLYETEVASSIIYNSEPGNDARIDQMISHFTGRGIVVCRPGRKFNFIYNGEYVKIEYFKTKTYEAIPELNIEVDYEYFYKIISHNLNVILTVREQTLKDADKLNKIEFHNCWEETY